MYTPWSGSGAALYVCEQAVVGRRRCALHKTAVTDNGFTVIDSILLEGALVQCAVAVPQVSAADTYQVTWSAAPVQGAQLWIAAVQSSS